MYTYIHIDFVLAFAPGGHKQCPQIYRWSQMSELKLIAPPFSFRLRTHDVNGWSGDVLYEYTIHIGSPLDYRIEHRMLSTRL